MAERTQGAQSPSPSRTVPSLVLTPADPFSESTPPGPETPKHALLSPQPEGIERWDPAPEYSRPTHRSARGGSITSLSSAQHLFVGRVPAPPAQPACISLPHATDDAPPDNEINAKLVRNRRTAHLSRAWRQWTGQELVPTHGAVHKTPSPPASVAPASQVSSGSASPAPDSEANQREDGRDSLIERVQDTLQLPMTTGSTPSELTAVPLRRTSLVPGDSVSQRHVPLDASTQRSPPQATTASDRTREQAPWSSTAPEVQRVHPVASRPASSAWDAQLPPAFFDRPWDDDDGWRGDSSDFSQGSDDLSADETARRRSTSWWEDPAGRLGECRATLTLQHNDMLTRKQMRRRVQRQRKIPAELRDESKSQKRLQRSLNAYRLGEDAPSPSALPPRQTPSPLSSVADARRRGSEASSLAPESLVADRRGSLASLSLADGPELTPRTRSSASQGSVAGTSSHAFSRRGSAAPNTPPPRPSSRGTRELTPTPSGSLFRRPARSSVATTSVSGALSEASGAASERPRIWRRKERRAWNRELADDGAPSDSDDSSTEAAAKARLLIHNQPLPPHHPQSELEYDVLYENQRGVVLFGMSKRFSPHMLTAWDPAAWTDKHGLNTALTPTTMQLPDATWEWVHPSWMVDMTYDTDEDGWQYSGSFTGLRFWRRPVHAPAHRGPSSWWRRLHAAMHSMDARHRAKLQERQDSRPDHGLEAVMRTLRIRSNRWSGIPTIFTFVRRRRWVRLRRRTALLYTGGARPELRADGSVNIVPVREATSGEPAWSAATTQTSTQSSTSSRPYTPLQDPNASPRNTLVPPLSRHTSSLVDRLEAAVAQAEGRERSPGARNLTAELSPSSTLLAAAPILEPGTTPPPQAAPPMQALSMSGPPRSVRFGEARLGRVVTPPGLELDSSSDSSDLDDELPRRSSSPRARFMAQTEVVLAQRRLVCILPYFLVTAAQLSTMLPVGRRARHEQDDWARHLRVIVDEETDIQNPFMALGWIQRWLARPELSDVTRPLRVQEHQFQQAYRAMPWVLPDAALPRDARSASSAPGDGSDTGSDSRASSLKPAACLLSSCADDDKAVPSLLRVAIVEYNFDRVTLAMRLCITDRLRMDLWRMWLGLASMDEQTRGHEGELYGSLAAMRHDWQKRHHEAHRVHALGDTPAVFTPAIERTLRQRINTFSHSPAIFLDVWDMIVAHVRRILLTPRATTSCACSTMPRRATPWCT